MSIVRGALASPGGRTRPSPDSTSRQIVSNASADSVVSPRTTAFRYLG